MAKQFSIFAAMAAVETAELCEELDGTLLEVMDCLKQLSRLRNQFGEDVKEVCII